jgi:alpha-1,2-mannosyltransferase
MPDHNPPAPRTTIAEVGGALQHALSTLLTSRRAAAWCAALLAVEIVTLLVVIAGTHGLLTTAPPAPQTTDFSSFYAAGRLADAGHPEAAYDQAAHYAEEQRDTAQGVIYSYFYYPPVFLLLCALLGRLPYLLSFVVFEVGTAALYLTAATRILARKHWVAFIAVLAFPANFWTIGLGQNGFLTAGLFGFATLLVDKRPWLAGMMFGSLLIKPHFGILIPVALLAGWHWRAIGGAALAVVVLAGLSLLCFGVGTWTAFIDSFLHSPSMYQSGAIGFELMVSVFGAMRLFGCAPPTAYAVQAIATLLCMAAVFVVWRRKLSLPVRAATLVSATIMAVPLILFYDLTILAIAMTWLVRPGVRPLSVTEKLLIGGVFGIALIMRTLTFMLVLPLGLLASCAVLGMALYRAAGEMKAQGRPALLTRVAAFN